MSLVGKSESQFCLPYCFTQTHFGLWVALDPNTQWRKEQHVRAQTPPPLPPKKWQAHFNPVSERSSAIGWQEILAADQDLPLEYFYMERELLLLTQAHVTSAVDPLLTKWADSSPMIWLSITEAWQRMFRKWLPVFVRDIPPCWNTVVTRNEY